MAQHYCVRSAIPDFRDNAIHGHRPELGVQQLHLMSGIEQRASQGQQPEGRQMFLRDAAANGRMRRVDQQYSHKLASDLRVDTEVNVVIYRSRYPVRLIYFALQSI